MRFLDGLRPATDLTYADVFMVPARSVVTRRFEVDLTTPDGVGTTLPLVVANMTAISGRRMAETVARRGGLAVAAAGHPARRRRRGGRAGQGAHPVYDTPITVDPDATVGEALA